MLMHKLARSPIAYMSALSQRVGMRPKAASFSGASGTRTVVPSTPYNCQAAPALGIERLAEQLEARRALARAHGGEWPPPTPSPTSCGEDQLQLVVKKIQNPVSLRLN